MAYKALYRTYRPLAFDEVVGQKYIVKTLRNAIKKDHIAHAYLFCGPRGTGKTTLAKIFARAVNCANYDEEPCNMCDNCKAIIEGTHPDVVEIDAASNNGVDEIRDLIEKVKYAPLQSKYKVYIIDEVHMLTQGAFNALLKTLEEPPAHVIFILATTEPHKVLQTIHSRCQRYDFGKVSDTDIVNRLEIVCKDANIAYQLDALKLIARLADGGMRDALSILDQCVSYATEDITITDIEEIYGLVSSAELVKLLNLIHNQEVQELLQQAKSYFDRGVDIKRLTSDLMEICKEALIYSYVKNDELLFKLNREETKKLLKEYRSSDLVSIIDLLLETIEKYRFSTNVNAYFEVLLIKATELFNSNSKVVEESNTKVESVGVVRNIDDLKNKFKELSIDVSRETLEVKTEPKVEEVTPVNDYEVDFEMLLEILVDANKVNKEKDNSNWNTFTKYQYDIQFAKYANLLKTAKIVASSEDALIVSVTNKSIANEINEYSDSEDMQELLMNVLGSDRFIVALTTEEEGQLIQLFKERRMSNTLPMSKSYKKDKTEVVVEEKKELTTEDRIIQLFGEGNVIIKE